MDQPMLSVIVPVYQVEPYLCRCLDSLLGQSYENLEILLVDDGSTDRSGAICAAYRSKDPRVRVIRQPNGGVASARNTGLRAAAGEWIGWVDSDDWIEPDMFAYLLGGALEYGADLAVCGRFEDGRGGSVRRGGRRLRLLDREEALGLLLENGPVQSFLWDKLFRRTLFDGISFPEGRTFEDVAVMHRLFLRAERVLCLPEAKYHYVQRGDSIVSDLSLSNRLNHYHAARCRYEDLLRDWPQFCTLAGGQCLAAAVGIWCGYRSTPRPEREQARPLLEELSQFARKHSRRLRGQLGLGMAGRAVLRLVPYPKWWAFLAADWICRAYRLRHGRAL